MDYRRLGDTGLRVSRICLGMMSYGDPARQEWALPEDEAEPLVRRAADGGVTFFDTADVYSVGASEVVTGNILRKIFPRREDYVLATKVYFPMSRGANDRGLSRKHILDSIDASLRRLGTDYVDLYQIHRWDDETPIEETMEALHDVVRSGKARYIGASSMWAWQFAKAQHVARDNGWTRFVSMQNHYNLLYREEEREMLPLCADQGVGVIPWSPLARGVLARAGASKSTTGAGAPESTTRAGSDARIDALYDPENDGLILDRVAEVAREHGLPAAQIALAWVLRQPTVTAPIVGATKPGHVDDALAALSVSLSDKNLASLADPYRPREVRM
ncbi:aldo/keto reductase [Nonomuraea sp. NEAU-A123]|uniref:aldo/keto reductase n=1 Tax=Nonomuraea sp. NEAU-A123 TaxID=2839649 RepID=UPI001BE41CCC|nr:aldo/keto reductase [Nonomuraea sp. NEAU-A123]MBT2230602.1 aldo/keto reductase [Nonomuraea sp. NEAU-A123]